MSDKQPEQYPHQPAAFINVIAEEGSKAEAIQHLQLTWNELSFVRKERNALRSQLSAAQAMNDKLAEALRFYAEGDWTLTVIGQGDIGTVTGNVFEDKGEVAKQALTAYE